MIVGILAILKTGACYVPQDVRLVPPTQLLRVRNACAAKVVLTLAQFVPKLPEFPGVSVIPIDTALASPLPVDVPVFQGTWRDTRPSDRCYIIFTSGTTGAPKGVQVTHGNVANVLLTDPMSLGMKPGLKVSQILSISFDMGAWEILGCLTHGAQLVIRARSIAHAVAQADVVVSTPTVLGTLDANEMRHVKTVAVAGEPCPRSLAEEWGKFCNFYNGCGPTEVTIINTAKLFDETEDVLTIGKPTPNNTVYVLDKDSREACKIGEVGEMWGGGLCVSRGYLNNEALTNERYVKDPFVENEGARMYRTGDLGRWNERGELEHLGRVDEQVKVKGFRVELDGVSACCEKASGCAKAVVLKVDDALVAWVTPGGVDRDEVLDCVKNRLPYYCVPKHVFCVEEFPKTGNGKVDKRALRKGMDDKEIPVAPKLSSAPKQDRMEVVVKTTKNTWISRESWMPSSLARELVAGVLSIFQRLYVSVIGH